MPKPNIEDDVLSLDDRARIVNDRRRQWAADLFTHRLTAEAAASAGANPDPQTVAAIATLESAIAALAPIKLRLDNAIAAAPAPVVKR